MSKENKKIAEFMGVFSRKGTIDMKKEWYSAIDLDSVGLPDELTLAEDLNFKQWHWLMPVVHKCLDIYHVEQKNDDLHFKFYDGLSYSIEVTYKVVVEFINEYNKNKS